MTRVPAISAGELIRVLRELGFEQVRVRGSHHRFEHPDGRRTTVPVDAGRDIPRGLLRKIVREDLRMEMEKFLALL